jgi:hypothetical protein
VVALHYGHFTPGKRKPGNLWIGGWIGYRAGLDVKVKRKVAAPAGDPAKSSTLEPATWQIQICSSSSSKKKKSSTVWKDTENLSMVTRITLWCAPILNSKSSMPANIWRYRGQ